MSGRSNQAKWRKERSASRCGIRPGSIDPPFIESLHFDSRTTTCTHQVANWFCSFTNFSYTNLSLMTNGSFSDACVACPRTCSGVSPRRQVRETPNPSLGETRLRGPATRIGNRTSIYELTNGRRTFFKIAASTPRSNGMLAMTAFATASFLLSAARCQLQRFLGLYRHWPRLRAVARGLEPK